MHPTANSVAFIRKTWMLVLLNARRVMPGVMLPLYMKKLEFWKPVIAATALTPVFWLIALASGGAGYGDFLGARVLFPYVFLTSLLPQSAPWSWIFYPVLFLSLIQYPLYGLVLSVATVKERLKYLAVGLGVAHIIAATVCGLFLDFSSSGMGTP